MKKGNNSIHPVNKNFRYLIWTFIGIICFVALASAYVYVTDTSIDMDDQPINNVTDPVNDQDAATKAYVDSSSTPILFSGGTGDFSSSDNKYCLISGGDCRIDTDSKLSILTTNGTFTKLCSSANKIGTGGYDIYLQIEEVSTSLTLTFNSTDDGILKCIEQDVDYTEGDTIGIYLNIGGSAAIEESLSWGLEFVSD